jgi:hypothetical protein
MRIYFGILFLFASFNIYSQSSRYIIVSSREEVNELLRSHAIEYAKALPSGNYLCIVGGNQHVQKRLQTADTVDNRWKVAPALLQSQSDHTIYIVQVTDIYAFKQWLGKYSDWFAIEHEHTASQTFLVKVKKNIHAIDLLVSCNAVTFVDKYTHVIQDETANSFQDLSVSKVNIVHDIYPELSGDRMAVCVKERLFDTTDIDLAGRYIYSSLADSEQSLHAGQMATIIAGGGNTVPGAKGVAWKSNVMSSSYNNLFPDDLAALTSQNVWVQNHSYGVSVNNIYGAEARAYDVSANTDPNMLYIFSAGNSGTTVSTSGAYAGIAGYANLSGNMKMAKNIVTVTAVDKDGAINPLNSSGPAYDGRVKPELTAFGSEGTSDAAAMVSGISLLVQQVYKERYQQLPEAALVKAILIASSQDVGKAGIDFISGYGAVDAYKAVQLVKASWLMNEAISSDEEEQFTIEVPAGIKKLKVALTWNDPAAAAGDATALVNNLNSTLIYNGSQWKPWVLNHYPHPDSLALPAVRKEDHLNTVEYITVDNPAAGTYQLTVTAGSLATDLQNFHVAYWLDSADIFQWTYPTKSDPLEAAQPVYLRWNNTFDQTGMLEISLDGGAYEVIAEDVTLTNGFYTWTTPAGVHTALARMLVNGIYIVSDTFTITPAMQIQVAYNCTEEVMLHWSKVPGAQRYRVFTMQDNYMAPVMDAADTAFIFRKENYPSPYFAVQPVIADKPGLRSQAYHYGDQGVHCYYRNFIASLTASNDAALSLALSTLYNVAQITFEKEQAGIFVPLNTIGADSNFLYAYTDETLQGGVTRYRAAITLEDGNIVYSDTAALYYGDDRTYIVYPNPVHASVQPLEVLTDGDNLTMVFYDATGRIVKTQGLYNSLFRFSMTDVNRGFYIYRIFRNGKAVAGGRLMVE